MLKKLYEEGYINKTPEQMRVIIARRLLREIRDEVQDNVDNLLDNYTADKISQEALLDLTDLLIDEMEIIDEILDDINSDGRLTQDALDKIPKLSRATKRTINGYGYRLRKGKIDADVFNEWKDNRADKDNLVDKLTEFAKK